MKKMKVNTSKPYEIIIERGSINDCGRYIAGAVKARKAAVITDNIVSELYGNTVVESLMANRFTCCKFVFENGESSKNLYTLSNIFDFLCENEITRHDIIIALGGGVVGDMAGFAASVYLRGIEFVQIPTTLLAQIDSSVGGKTGIDIKGGKNLVGAFKQPALVICDSNVLSTLSHVILSDGMAEAIKYGMIRDVRLFNTISSHNIDEADKILDEIIYECIDIKRGVVENDEFEKGERMILNFGHTIGHAIESYFNYSEYTHGQGVSIGMSYMCSRTSNTDTYSRLVKCLESYKLPTQLPVNISHLIPYCCKDKKREFDTLNYIVCEEPGMAEIRKATLSEFAEIMGVSA